MMDSASPLPSSSQPSQRSSSGAAQRNKDHIVQHLRSYVEEFQSERSHGDTVQQPVKVLEVASGTGEHAAFFSEEISGTTKTLQS
jgi:ubiquinone/menaquinone biosynthesis C-methylase UbiE